MGYSSDFLKPITVIVGVVSIVLGVILWFSGFMFLGGISEIVQRGWALILAVFLFGVGALLYSVNSSKIVGVAVILVSLLSFGYGIFLHPYKVDSAYAQGIERVDEQVNYTDRAPWVVANDLASRDQGELIGDRKALKSVPNIQTGEVDAKTTRYSTIVTERGIPGFRGYEAIQQMNMPNYGLVDSSVSDYCELPEDMNKRFGSVNPFRNLEWSISLQNPFAHWSSNDLYSYCDEEGDPVIIQPLYKYQGFFSAVKEPNGAAVYKDGSIKLMDAEALKKEKIQGPTYPMSLAKTQRGAINAGGSLVDYYSNRYGYDTTEKDEEDANETNVSEFLMTDFNNEGSFVTPLTPRGSSQSIVAVSDINSVQVGEGRNPILINDSPDLPSTSTIDQRIREASVDGDSSWATRWSSGMRVYEILPAQDGNWVASVGQGQSVSYKATISPEGSVNVQNVEEDSKNSESSDDTEKKDDEKTDEVTVSSDKKLEDMTDKELLDLISEGVAELESRQ